MLEAIEIKFIQPYILIQLLRNILILNQTQDVSNEKQELQSHTTPLGVTSVLPLLVV